MFDLREKSKRDVKATQLLTVEKHPWYKDLVNKVIIVGGIERRVTSPEKLILSQIKRVIEDELPFNKSDLINIFRCVPTSEFVKDEVQKIIRFVKTHETIPEKDYFEALEIHAT